jgi:hypothetical protein
MTKTGITPLGQALGAAQHADFLLGRVGREPVSLAGAGEAALSYKLMAGWLAALTHRPIVLAPWPAAHVTTAQSSSMPIPLPRHFGAPDPSTVQP